MTSLLAVGDDQIWFTPQLVVSSVGALVSCLAFATTIVFFRRLNTRRGRLSSVRPHSFAYSNHPVLPLVIYNDGAVPIIVQDLRLRLDKTAAQIERDAHAKRRHKPEPPGG